MNNNEQLLFDKFLLPLKFLFRLNQFFGLMPITWSNKKFYVSNILIFYTVMQIILYFLLMLYCEYKILNITDKVVSIITSSILFISGPMYIILTWITALRKREKLIRFLEEVFEFDTVLKEHDLYIKYQNKICSIPCASRYILMFLFISWSVYIQYQNMVYHLSMYFLIAYHVTVSFQLIELAKLLRTRFRILNHEILRIIKHHSNSKKDFKSVNLMRICSLHHHLSKLVLQFNDIFGFVTLLLFTFNFMVIVLTSFYFSAYVQSEKITASGAFLNIIPMFESISDTIYICNTCYTTQEELKKSAQLIHKIETEESDIIDEIEMFSLQVSNNNIHFSAAGFFPIDYTLLFSVSATNLVLLIWVSSLYKTA